MEWASSAWLPLARRCRSLPGLHLRHHSCHFCPRVAIWGDLEEPHVCLPLQTHKSKPCLLLLSWRLVSWKPRWSKRIKVEICLLKGICLRLKELQALCALLHSQGRGWALVCAHHLLKCLHRLWPGSAFGQLSASQTVSGDEMVTTNQRPFPKGHVNILNDMLNSNISTLSLPYIIHVVNKIYLYII